MATEDKRYPVIPKTPKDLPGFNFVTWFTWYCDNEPRLSENHSRARVAQRLLAGVDGLKPPTDEIDALKEAKDNVAKLKAELEQAEKWLAALESGPTPKPIPAYEGDIGEWTDADWTLLKGFLTSSDAPPKCGLAPGAVTFQRADGTVVQQTMPARLVLDYIAAIVDAPTKKPEPAKALPEPAPEANEAPPAEAAAE